MSNSGGTSACVGITWIHFGYWVKLTVPGLNVLGALS